MNNLPPKIRLLFILLLFKTFANGQTPFEKSIDELKARENIVITESPPTSTIENLKLKGRLTEIETVNRLYEEHNNSVKAMIEAFWIFGKGVKYMTWEEFDKMDNETKKNYCLLYFETVKPTDNFFKAKRLGYIELEQWMIDDEHGIASYDFIQTFSVAKAEDLKRGKINLLGDAYFSIQLPELIPSGVTIAFALREAQKYLNVTKNRAIFELKRLPAPKSENHTTASEVDDMTLYINRNWFPDELDFDDFKYLFPFPSKLVSLEEIEEAVYLQKPNIIYYFIEPQIQYDTKYRTLNFNRYIIEAKTGKVLFSYLLPMGFTGKLTEKHYEINHKFVSRFLEFRKE